MILLITNHSDQPSLLATPTLQVVLQHELSLSFSFIGLTAFPFSRKKPWMTTNKVAFGSLSIK